MGALEPIENIFTRIANFCCFACCPSNASGLKLAFFLDRETGEAVTRLVPRDVLSGFPGILHGGIQTTVLDELAFWAVFGAHRLLSMTAEIKVRFHAPIPLAAPLEARARATRPRLKLSHVAAQLRDAWGAVLTEAEITAYVPSREVWRDHLGGSIPEILLPFIPER